MSALIVTLESVHVLLCFSAALHPPTSLLSLKISRVSSRNDQRTPASSSGLRLAGSLKPCDAKEMNLKAYPQACGQ